MNILVVAPHADDEVLGCGGILAKYAKAGNNTYVAVMTNAHLGDPQMFSQEGIDTVRGEALQAHKILGVKQTFFFDYPAPRLDTAPAYQISVSLNKLITDLAIDVMYIPHRGDMHKDHGVIFLAALVAARPINNCPVKQIYTYETLSETEWAPPFGNDVFIPTVFEDITEVFPLKVQAMERFRSQLKEFPHPRSIEGLSSLAKFRGSTVSIHFAESFALIRDIRS